MPNSNLAVCQNNIIYENLRNSLGGAAYIEMFQRYIIQLFFSAIACPHFTFNDIDISIQDRLCNSLRIYAMDAQWARGAEYVYYVQSESEVNKIMRSVFLWDVFPYFSTRS
jgi:hypothetical protein